MRQTTVSRRIKCTGVGLHGGKKVRLTLRPAAEDTGIVFHVHTPYGKKDISPSPEAVIATGLATTLGRDGVAVSTVEHLLAALRGLSIDNIHIDVEGGEIPIMDGSAAPFAMLIAEAGVRYQTRARAVYRVKRPVSFGRDGKSIQAEPHDGFFVDCSINFPHPAIGRQRMSLEVTPQTFARVSKARTFGFLRDVEMMKERGLALGGSLANAVVLDDQGVLNKEGLRHADEFVRHKLLDFIGDMAMLPLPVQGRFTVSCSGHALNNEFLRHIAAAPALYLDTVKLGSDGGGASPLPLRHALEEDVAVHAVAG
jgi:UDP-3-O-[3-hydroxymyristoyl] N-acetylglucosamine deacetylase